MLWRNPGGQFVSRKHTVPSSLLCHTGTALDTLLVSSTVSCTGRDVSETRGGKDSSSREPREAGPGPTPLSAELSF